MSYLQHVVGDKTKVVGESKTTKTVVYQLLTDVDDTLHPSGFLGYGLAGVDSEGRRDEYYPCVRKLHTAFYNNFELPTIIVSANPLWKSKSSIENIARELGAQIEYKGGDLASSLWSTILNLLPGIPDNRDDYYNLHYMSMANVKIAQISEHIKKMRDIYAGTTIEYRAIWIGDNGQGDLLAAKKLLQKELIFAALIHIVDPNKQTGRSSAWARPFGDDPKRLFPFDNYKTVITQLRSLGLNFLENCDEKTKDLTRDQKKKIEDRAMKWKEGETERPALALGSTKKAQPKK